MAKKKTLAEYKKSEIPVELVKQALKEFYRMPMPSDVKTLQFLIEKYDEKNLLYPRENLRKLLKFRPNTKISWCGGMPLLQLRGDF